MNKVSESSDPLEHIAKLDSNLQHRVRLAICVLLADDSEMSFSRLKELLQETDGSLGAQLRKLEDEKYLDMRKEIVGRKPVTWYRLSAAGRLALSNHIESMQALARMVGSGNVESKDRSA